MKASQSDAGRQSEALQRLRAPFPLNQVSKLPKPTKAQTDAVKADFKKGQRCEVCGAWHHPSVVHLDYVGHAALTDRLLEVDPLWNWEPLAFDASGLPAIDKDGGLWIKLTVCGMTRMGYGDASNKIGGDAMKERIGDALRNAGIRFGAALDLWHKGDLHAHENGGDSEQEPTEPPSTYPDEQLNKNLPAWSKAIQSGKKTPEQIIAMVQSKAPLSEQQQNTIRECVAKEGETV